MSCDPRTTRCRISNAGHLPPILVDPDGKAHLLDIPTGVPLGVGDIAFSTVDFDLAPPGQVAGVSLVRCTLTGAHGFFTGFASMPASTAYMQTEGNTAF